MGSAPRFKWEHSKPYQCAILAMLLPRARLSRSALLKDRPSSRRKTGKHDCDLGSRSRNKLLTQLGGDCSKMLQERPQIDMHSLLIGIRLQARLAQLPPNATLLHTTERYPEVTII